MRGRDRSVGWHTFHRGLNSRKQGFPCLLNAFGEGREGGGDGDGKCAGQTYHRSVQKSSAAGIYIFTEGAQEGRGGKLKAVVYTTSIVGSTLTGNALALLP